MGRRGAPFLERPPPSGTRGGGRSAAPIRSGGAAGWGERGSGPPGSTRPCLEGGGSPSLLLVGVRGAGRGRNGGCGWGWDRRRGARKETGTRRGTLQTQRDTRQRNRWKQGKLTLRRPFPATHTQVRGRLTRGLGDAMRTGGREPLVTNTNKRRAGPAALGPLSLRSTWSPAAPPAHPSPPARRS